MTLAPRRSVARAQASGMPQVPAGRDTLAASGPQQIAPVLPVLAQTAPAPIPPAPAARTSNALPTTESATRSGDAGTEARLPIFDSVESDWFRRGGPPISRVTGSMKAATGSWSSPADDGFRAAQAAASPTTGDVTGAGLPKRVPSANLVPGSIGTRPRGQQAGQAPPPAARPVRSPEEARTRLKGFQVRGREGRTDAPQQQGTNEN